MEDEVQPNKKSDAYAIVAFAFALSDLVITLSGLGLSRLSTVYSEGFIGAIQQAVVMISIPLIFGIIGLKSTAKKLAITAIALAALNILLLVIAGLYGVYSYFN